MQDVVDDFIEDDFLEKNKKTSFNMFYSLTCIKCISFHCNSDLYVLMLLSSGTLLPCRRGSWVRHTEGLLPSGRATGQRTPTHTHTYIYLDAVIVSISVPLPVPAASEEV